MATLTTLVTFNGTDGARPGGLLLDATGDLLGTTAGGGANSSGTAFEIVDSSGLYASTPTTLVNFGANGGPGSLSSDAAGDLFGTTQDGGTDSDGTVFEIAKSGGLYASTATTLASFTSGYIFVGGADPSGALLIDSAGDLFGTTAYGAAGTSQGFNGTVFEVANTVGGYASTPTILTDFDNPVDGKHPYGGLIADAAGDLFGTVEGANSANPGKVYELAKTAGGYSSEPTILVTFGAADEFPSGGLVADAAGNLFGTTGNTLFEISLVDGIYATTPHTLVNFLGSVDSGLIMDAAGDLFGTTASDDGDTVFEVVNTPSGYTDIPTILYSSTNNLELSVQVADAAGDLFGTTVAGGANGDGTAFELTNTGYQVSSLVLFGGGATVVYTLGGAAVAIGAALDVTDPASATLSGATVSITTGFDLGDQLNVANQNGIAGSYNSSTGVLTLTGSASLANYQAALQSITFSSTSDNLTSFGTDLSRTVSFTATDGARVSSATTDTISLTGPAVGASILGYLDLDDFTVAASGQVSDEEFNSQGMLLATLPLMVAGSVPFTITPGEALVGSAINFLGNDLRNILVRHPNGQLVEEGIAPAGLDIWTQPLWTGSNTPFTIDPTATIAGSALNFSNNGLYNLFVREANGQVTDQGFSTAGLDIWTESLTGFTADPAATIAASSFNFLGNGLNNLFVVHDNGQVVDEGFTSGGADIWTQPLWATAGTPFTLDPIASIAGTGLNFLGNGLNNLFVVHDNGQLVDEGFTKAGLDTWTQPLTVGGGGAFAIDPATSVVGVGQNFLASGGYDLFLRGVTGQVSVSEFSQAGVLTGSSSLPALGNGASFQVQVGTTGNDSLTGPAGASTLIGDGGNDTYGFGPAAGHEIIVNGTTSNVAAAGTLNMTATSSDTRLWLDRVNDNGAVSASGNNLRIDVLGTTKSVTIDDWFAPGDSGAQLAEIELPGASGGTLKLDSGVSALVQAMATFEAGYSSGHAGAAFDPTSTANSTITDSTVLAAVSSAWHT